MGHVREYVRAHPRLYNLCLKTVWPIRRHNLYRYITAPLRALPNFVIIGAAKSGTTSLYDMVTGHPDILPARFKEPAYFNKCMQILVTYKTNFPILTQRLTGEASTSYLNSPVAPARMIAIIPNAKIIAILRNPVDRAYSQYHFLLRKGVETAPTFEDALQLEETRYKEYRDGIRKQRDIYWAFYRRYGHYAEHLQRWLQYYDRDRLLVLSTEEFKRDRQGTVHQVFEFLKVKPYTIPADAPNRNVGRYEEMRSDTRQELVKHFRPHNEQLYSLLGRRFDWDR